MSLIGANSLRESLARTAATPWDWAVHGGQFAIGATAVGVVATTLLGRMIGLRLLWLFAVFACLTAPLAAWALAGAPASDVFMAALGALLVSGAAVWYGRRRLHAAITRRQWPEVLAEHQAAADEMAAALGAVTPAQWGRRPRPEAWSPSDIAEHLARTYSQYAGEARGKNSLRVRVRLPLLLLVRAFVKPRLLSGAPFPKAKAPRALQPISGPATPDDGVALFRATGTACLRDLTILAERRPYRKLVHPYLGALPLYELVRFATHHVRHHHRQLLATLGELPRQDSPNAQSP
jgi:hypothetical protein